MPSFSQPGSSGQPTSRLLQAPLACALAPLALVGCALSPTPDAADAEATSSTATAVVVVERTLGPGDAVRADAVIARFVRVRQGSVDDQALRLAGADWDLPPVGTCSATEPARPSLQRRSVDLLDVGALTIDADPHAPFAKATVLLPRTMPDPTGVVSGVFYSGRAAEPFSSNARLQLRTPGGPDLPEGFALDVAVPEDVTELEVASSRAGLELTWDASEPAAGDARDVVYVDVLAPSARLVTRCTTLDVGHLSVPSASLGSIDEGQIVVHRFHRETFKTKGIEPGEIRFDVARVATFRR